MLQVALLALVAVASGKSFFQGFPYVQPGLQTPYATGFQGIGTPFAPLAPHTGMFNPMFNPYLLNQGGLRFKRSADSDSDSFYHGFPFVPPTAYGTPFGIPYGYQQPSLPSVVPRVLPYNFPAAFPQQQYYSPVYRPVMAIEKAEKVEQQ